MGLLVVPEDDIGGKRAIQILPDTYMVSSEGFSFFFLHLQRIRSSIDELLGESMIITTTNHMKIS